MKYVLIAAFLAAAASGTIIDRIAVIAGNSIIKDSDIERDIRATDFLNGSPLDLGQAAKKKAASRLLDQTFIRREIRIGDYQTATPQQAEQQLEALKKQRFRTDAAYARALSIYGLNDLELRSEFQWQLTVLQFIDARFKPAAYIPDSDIESYYKTHADQLRREYPKKQGLEQLREDIRSTLAGEKVNQLFFAWLDEQRKAAKIQYLEGGLA